MTLCVEVSSTDVFSSLSLTSWLLRNACQKGSRALVTGSRGGYWKHLKQHISACFSVVPVYLGQTALGWELLLLCIKP